METTFYFYDATHILKPYVNSLPSGFADGMPEGCEPPDYSILTAPEQRPGFWPVLNAKGDGWDYAEDHRQKKDERDRIIEGTGTMYWLAPPQDEGDTWQSPARYMTDIGPLPDGAMLTQPEKPLATAQDEKCGEINRAHGEVLSYLLAESPSPTAVEAALAVEDMRSDDPEGLQYVRGLADSRRAELLAAVDAAGSVADVAAIVVSYPV